MKISRAVTIAVAALLLTASAVFSANLFAGYGGLRWGTDIHTVLKTFRNGTLGKIGGQMVYTQRDPDRTARQRTFGFSSSGLEAVSITFRASYVQQVGIETILRQLMKNFGEGHLNRSSAPHLISYFWEDPFTRITLTFSGTSPDMTVLLFQQKK